MLIQILQNAPAWVWGLLAALVALGLLQCRDRALSLARGILTPMAMVGLSLFGLGSTFGAQPLPGVAWLEGLAIGAIFALATRLWAGIGWQPAERRLTVPGSWLPLALILAIFATRFVVGAALAMQPAYRVDPLFGTLVGLACGSLSGIFLGRGLAMWNAARGAPMLRA
jgi:hypothetical protein